MAGGGHRLKKGVRSRMGGHRALASYHMSPEEKAVGEVMGVARKIRLGQRRSLILANCAMTACAKYGVKIEEIKQVLFQMLDDPRVINAIDKRLEALNKTKHI